MAKLSFLGGEMAGKVLTAIDQVAAGYSIEKTCSELIVYQDGMPDVCKSYLVSRSIEGISQKTLNLYRQVLTKFFSTIKKPLQKVTANDIRVWLYEYETNHKISKRTLELYRLVISGFFNWASVEGWLQSNPCAQIKPIKYVKKPRKAMAQIELEYIREACANEKESAIVEMLYSTGCRVSQLSAIKLSDINWERKEVTLFGKGGKYRTAFLNAKAIVALRNYLDTRKDNCSGLIVASHYPHKPIGKNGLELIVRTIAKRVEGKLSVPVTPHVFRHTTATAALQHGMPIQDVQIMLGHRNINTTMVYTEINQSEVKDMHTKCVI